MADRPTDERDAVGATLAEKYRSFLEGLSDEEFALYRISIGLNEDDDAESEGFEFDVASLHHKIAVAPMATVFREVTINRTKGGYKFQGE